MKQIICLFVALCLTGYLLKAQELVQKKYIIYNTKIQNTTGHVYNGFIAAINDSTVFLSEKKFALTFENLDLAHLQKFGYGDISTISLRASGSVRRGALIGGITGFVVGALAGVMAVQTSGPKNSSGLFPQPSPAEAALIGGFVVGGLGSLIGMICGHTHQVFQIHGKKAKLDDMREAMIRRLY